MLISKYSNSQIFAVTGSGLVLAAILLGNATSAPASSHGASTTTPDISAQDDSSEESPAATKNGEAKRVIIRLGRRKEVMGVVELKDDDVIVIRDRDGELQSFARGRVLQIVPLVDPEPGQTGIVVLKNGQQRQGIIHHDTFDEVLIEIHGG